VSDHPSDHGLVELVSELGPVGLRAGVDERVAATFGKVREGPVARLAVDGGVRLDAAPEVDVDQRPFGGKSGSIRSPYRSSAISRTRSVPSSSDAIRPAKLSLPASMRRAELPVTTTCTVWWSTKALSCGAQSGRF
jgi:hypothetical protein